MGAEARSTPSRTNPCRRVPPPVSTSCVALLLAGGSIANLLPTSSGPVLRSAQLLGSDYCPEPKTVLLCFLSSAKSALSVVRICCSCTSFLPQLPSASVAASPVATITISGPTSFAPVIDAAIDVVEKSNGQYHVLVIIADGQVSRNPDTGGRKRLGTQEQATINYSIVAASHYPL